MTFAHRALVVALLSVGGLLGRAGDAPAQIALRIGASVSQSGPYGSLGSNQLRGYQICVKQANERGGVLGRRLELIVDDDRSDPATAVGIYERLVKQDKVDAILGPYSSSITEAVADVAEKHRLAMVAPGAAATSIFKRGRRFVFMVLTPGERYHEGLIDLAARRGLKTAAIVHDASPVTRAIAQGTSDLAKRRGLAVVLLESYPSHTTDFSSLLGRIRSANPDVVAAATYFDDVVAITRQMRELDVNPRMFGVTAGGDLPKFYELVGRNGEFVYGATQWEPELMMLVRDGQRIPLSRRYPGAREFVEAHGKDFPGADLSYHTACGYTGCQVLLEAIRRAGALDGEKLRATILKMDLNTVYGAFRVDAEGVQVAHGMLTFQWQDGKKVIVWPDELTPGHPRFPTPPWSQR